jgi:hypothetical protein
LQKASKLHAAQGLVYAQHHSDYVDHRADCRNRLPAVTFVGISGHVAGIPAVTFAGTSVTIPESPVTLDRNTQ